MATVERMNEKKRLQIQVDRNLSEQVELILDAVGLTPSAALTVFYKQIARQGKIPFLLEASEKDKAAVSLLAAAQSLPLQKMDRNDLEAWLEEDEY